MKKVLLAFSVIMGTFIFVSCGPKKQQVAVEEVTEVVAVDEIVKDSIVDANGNKLYLTFNNEKGTLQAIFKGDTIVMSQDTTASGIKFSNMQYVYEEWQGKVTLKKDGNIIFQNEK